MAHKKAFAMDDLRPPTEGWCLLRVWGVGCIVQGVGCGVEHFGFRVQDVALRVSGAGCRLEDLGI